MSICLSAKAICICLISVLWSGYGLAQSRVTGTVSPITSSSSEQEQAGTQSLPESVRYPLFFRFLASLDQFASKLENEGNKKAAAAWKTHVQRAAGIDDNDAEILKKIAYDCNQSLDDNHAQLASAMKRFRDQYPNGAFRKAARPPEVIQLRSDKQQILASHIDQLKSEVSEESLRKVDSYIASVFRATVRTKMAPSSSVQRGRAATHGIRKLDGGLQ